MPFVQETPENENYKNFQKRQIVVWVVLLFIVLVTVLFLFYISYQVVSEENQGSSLSTGSTSIVTPISKTTSESPVITDTRYILYGQYFPQDSKYYLNKIFYNTFNKQELFSFVWRDNSSQPSFAFLENAIAVFPDVNKGFLVSSEGKLVINPTDFIPPDSHFSISPDKKRMFYFTYLSSIGTTSLTLRDMEKEKDIVRWPVSSSASQLCDFVGWSSDNTKAFCLVKNNGTVTLKSFNTISHAVTTITSKKNIIDASYNLQQKNILSISRNVISLYNLQKNEWQDIVSVPLDSSFEKALLVPDGSGLVYVQHKNNAISTEKKTYFITLNGTGQREIQANGSEKLVAISSDSQMMLFESPDKASKSLQHYSIIYLNSDLGENSYLVDIPISGTQFISWSK